MGLFGGHQDQSPLQRYQMREKLMSIGDDAWIDDESGAHVFKVDGKVMRVRDTFELKRADDGEVVAKIQERMLSVRDKMHIDYDDRAYTITKNLIGFRDRFNIDASEGSDLKAHGNFLDHEYEIERDGETVATISKKWFRVRDTYGVEIREGVPVPLILSITVAIDEMTEGPADH